MVAINWRSYLSYGGGSELNQAKIAWVTHGMNGSELIEGRIYLIEVVVN
jgi:hypothetical protein